MKRFLTLIIFAMALLSCSVYAEELRFEPVGGGKFIYSNNPEGIEDTWLLNGDDPHYIMNNTDLGADEYYIYLSHFNYTGSGKVGYDIELDMEMTAKEDSIITIKNASFETPREYAFYKDGIRTLAEGNWADLNVCCDMLGVPMCTLDGEDFYTPNSYQAKTIHIKKGETVWLSQYLNNYEKVNFVKSVHIQAIIDIDEGLMDFNVGAFRHNGILGDRSGFDGSAKFGEYRWDYCVKGIADSLPEVSADVEYMIDEETEDGTAIPMTLYNQYAPKGNTVTSWFTQLNPQNDIWSKTTAAESDMLPLYYIDDTKPSRYGNRVAEEERDNVWRFDTLHSSTSGYETKSGSAAAELYKPNFLLKTDKDNHEYACNLGNYGVATTYRMKVTNNSSETKYCSLVLTAASCVIAYETDSEGVKSEAYVKEITGEKTRDVMLSHRIPAGSTEEFSFSLILPVNYNGGIQNQILITDKDEKKADYSKLLAAHQEYKEAPRLNGCFVSEAGLSDEALSAFKGNEDSYEYINGVGGAIVRWCAWDGAPNWYYNLWGCVNTVYATDRDGSIKGSFNFPSLPCDAAWNDGYYYINTARDGVYKSADGVKWTKESGEMPPHNSYYDLENASEWAADDLERAYAAGLRLDCFEDGKYHFTDKMTRGGFCGIAADLLKRFDAFPKQYTVGMFSDNDSENVDALASVGVIKGFGDGTFRADDGITREQAAVILSRLWKHIGAENNGEASGYVYADSDEISDWAREDVAWIYDLGIMHGVGDDVFAPQEIYTREQSAITFLRLFLRLDI